MIWYWSLPWPGIEKHRIHRILLYLCFPWRVYMHTVHSHKTQWTPSAFNDTLQSNLSRIFDFPEDCTTLHVDEYFVMVFRVRTVQYFIMWQNVFDKYWSQNHGLNQENLVNIWFSTQVQLNSEESLSLWITISTLAKHLPPVVVHQKKWSWGQLSCIHLCTAQWRKYLQIIRNRASCTSISTVSKMSNNTDC